MDEKSNYTILVVDDDEAIRDLMEKGLMANGFRVMTAANGLHALQKMRADPFLYDLVITDVRMRGLDGLTFLQEFKKDSAVSHVPVLLMTGFASKEVVEVMKREGGQGLIVKPFKFSDLVERIHEVLRIAKSEKAG